VTAAVRAATASTTQQELERYLEPHGHRTEYASIYIRQISLLALQMDAATVTTAAMAAMVAHDEETASSHREDTLT